jgi:hypothetical protein
MDEHHRVIRIWSRFLKATEHRSGGHRNPQVKGGKTPSDP